MPNECLEALLGLHLLSFLVLSFFLSVLFIQNWSAKWKFQLESKQGEPTKPSPAELLTGRCLSQEASKRTLFERAFHEFKAGAFVLCNIPTPLFDAIDS